LSKQRHLKLRISKILNKSLESKLKSFDNKSLGDDLNEIKEAFRNPNVLIASIQEIELKQQRAIEDIQSKLNEMDQVKVNIKRTNEFKPNVSFSKDLFGHLSLNNYSNDILSSKILTGNQPSDLLKLCEFSLVDEWTLLYRGITSWSILFHTSEADSFLADGSFQFKLSEIEVFQKV
jgi:hypothetical protein